MILINSYGEESHEVMLHLTHVDLVARLPWYGMRDDIVTPSRARSRKSLAELNQVHGISDHLLGYNMCTQL